jgi:hypothetical protein
MIREVSRRGTVSAAPGVNCKRTLAGFVKTLLAVQNADHLGIGLSLIFFVVFAAKIRPQLLDITRWRFSR